MKHQKDIFDLFRENQHKLEERPSNRTWQRLERRLDAQQRTGGRKNLFFQLSMIAALLAFLVIVSVVVILPKNAEAIAQNNNFEAIPLADLETEESNVQAYEVAVFTKQMHNRLANPVPIPEGEPNKKLLPSNLSVSNDKDFYVVSRHKDKINVKPHHTNTKEVAYHKPVQALFNWLVGDWKSESANQLSMEMWSARDSQTLEGKGFLLKDGDTTFAEQMSITNVGSDIYFATQLDSSKGEVQFKLTALNDSGAVFENTTVDFPQQVILKQNDSDNFSTIYTNAQPVDMPESQIGYMLNRNAVIHQQAIRNMDRINK